MSWLARTLNAVGTAGAAFGMRPRLAPDHLMARARRQAGTGHDFETDDFRAPLDILCDSLEREANLTFLGRLVASTDVARRLENRLRIEASIRAYPDMLDRPVTAPVFILGLPRTGTTLLHRMLACDPSTRVLLGWETDQPAPPPDPSTYERDPRIRQTARSLDGLHWINPRFRHIHEVDARLPEECINLMANDLVSLWFALAYDTPSYHAWFNDLDFVRCYRNHRRQLQLLQYGFDCDRWVLKAPMHMFGLRALLEVYPDARFIQIHRDPVQVVPSAASLAQTFRQPLHRHTDPQRIGEGILEDLSRWWTTGQAVRASHSALPWVDVDYRELVADPLACVRTIYRTFGLELRDSTVDAMRSFLARNRQHKHGVHRYRPEDFGLTEATIHDRFSV